MSSINYYRSIFNLWLNKSDFGVGNESTSKIGYYCYFFGSSILMIGFGISLFNDF